MTDPDSISAFNLSAMPESHAPWAASDAARFSSRDDMSYLVGIEGIRRETGFGENSWLSLMVLVMLVILALNFGNCRRLFKNLPQELVGLRRRDSTGDIHTSSEARTSLLIILLLCVCEGVLMFTWADRLGLTSPVIDPFPWVLMLGALALGYFFFQYAAFVVVGNTFTDRYLAAQWLRGFVMSQLLLSILLMIPALVALYWASLAGAMLSLAAAIYVVTRLMFICKGFRIFYNNFLSLLYFILYLCTLEITPLLMLRKIVVYIF